MRLVRVRQTSTGTDIPIPLTTTPIPPIRRCCHSDNNIRCWNMVCNKTTRRNTPHCTAQNASTHHPDEKNIQIKKEHGGKVVRDDEISEETQGEDSTHDEYDQDSSVSFDDEDSTASQEDDSENWIEYIKRSTKEADEKMLTCNITNGVETPKKQKWRHALADRPKIQTDGPEKPLGGIRSFIISTKTQRRAGRPAKRWEDDLKDFVKDDETEATQSNDLKNKNTWLITAKNIYEKGKERNTTRQTRWRPLRNPTQLPATTRHCHQHHDEDLVLFVEFLYRGIRISATCDEWHAHYAVCSMPCTRTNGPLSLSSVDRFNISLRD